MPAQLMKDELDKSTSESAAQRSVTDWLMHVISGKQLAEERARAAAEEAKKPEAVNGAVAVEAPPKTNGAVHHAIDVEALTKTNGAGNHAAAEAPQNGAVHHAIDVEALAKTNGALNGAGNGAGNGAAVFTAEDLCGKPAVAVSPNGNGAAPRAEEITADDVCWVPVERRLKPQPTIPVEPLAAVAPLIEEAAPPAPIVEAPVAAVVAEAPVAPVIEAASAPLTEEAPSEASAPEGALNPADLLREPAPHFEDTSEMAIAKPEEREITAADISRQWVIDEMERAAAAAATQVEIPATQADVTAPPADLPVTQQQSPEAIAEEPEPAVAEVAPVAAEAPTEAVVAEQAGELEVVEIEAGPAEAAAEPEATPEAETDEEPEVIAGPQLVTMKTEAVDAPRVNEAAENVWAREGFWDGEKHAPKGELEPPQVHSIEERHVETIRPAAHGVLGSYMGPEDLAELEKAKPEGWSATWRTLIRLGSALPWLSRALPTIEAGLPNSEGAGAANDQPAAAGMPADVRQDVAGMRMVQYEIRTTVQDHSTHLKRLEDQLGRVREAVDSKASDDAELTASVNAAMRKLRIVGFVLGGLLLVLILLVALLVAKH